MSFASDFDLEQLIQELAAGNSDAVQKLHHLQKEEFGWQLVTILLNSSDTNCQFYGAHTLHVKTSRDWEGLSDERILSLREEIFRRIVQFRSGPQVVLRKLCSALAAYAIHTVPHQWPSFIKEIVEQLDKISFESSSEVATAKLPIFYELFTTLPETLNRTFLMGPKKAQLHQEIIDSLPLLFSRLDLGFRAESSDGAMVEQQRSLKVLESWIQFGIPFLSYAEFLPAVNYYLQFPTTFEAAVDLLVEVFTQQSINRYETTICGGTLAVLKSPALQSLHHNLLSGAADHELASIMVRLVTSLGEAFPKYIVSHLSDGAVVVLIEMVLDYTSFPGAYPDEEQVSELCLNFWCLLQQAAEDASLLGAAGLDGPVEKVELSKHMVGRPRLSVFDADGDPRKVVWGAFAMATLGLCRKIAYPSFEALRGWSKETRDQFRNYRQDVADVLLSAYYVLRQDYIRLLLVEAQNSPQGETMEAVLYCIRSVSESIPADGELQIERLFRDEVIGRFGPESDPTLCQQMLLLISALAEWLNFHKEDLMCAVGFVLPFLAQPHLSSHASRALRELAHACQRNLAEAAPALLSAYRQVQSRLKANDKRNLIESVLYIIEVLPSGKNKLVMEVLSGILNNIAEVLFVVRQNPAQNATVSADTVADLVDCLTAGSRSISPDTGHALVPEATELQASKDRVWHVICQVLETWIAFEDVVKAVCSFLNESVRSGISVVSFPLPKVAELLASVFAVRPYASLIDTASQLVSTYGDDLDNRHILTPLLNQFISIALQSASNRIEEEAGILSRFFTLLSRCVRRNPALFLCIREDLLGNVLALSKAALLIQNRQALKSNISFLVDLLNADFSAVDGMQKEYDIELAFRSVLHQQCPEWVDAIILGIGGTLPRSYVTLVADLLYRIATKFPMDMRGWLHQCFRQSEFPSNTIDDKEKDRFVTNILSMRSSRQFKDAVLDFTLKCRGLYNTYYVPHL